MVDLKGSRQTPCRMAWGGLARPSRPGRGSFGAADAEVAEGSREFA